MSNNLESISDIFQKRIFRIPDYQRGYSWGTKQLEDLWEDLENLKDDKKRHYTGLLTLEPVSKEKYSDWEDGWLISGKKFKPVYVVDGQQRLTTIIILIQVIIEKLDELGSDKINDYTAKREIVEQYIFPSASESVPKSFVFGYEKDNPSYEFLKTQILGEKSNSNQDVRTVYTINLQKAKCFFTKKVEKHDLEGLSTLYNKVTTLLTFNLHVIEDDLDVFVAFETMNNRGKKLSNLELMKNRLIYLSTLFSEEQETKKDQLRNNINEVWKTVYHCLGKNEEVQLDDDEFIENHWKMYSPFKFNKKKANEYANFLLNQRFTVKNVINGELGIEDIQKYLDSIQESVKIWFDIHNPEHPKLLFSELKPSSIQWLLKIKMLKYGEFKPLLMAMLSKSHDYFEIDEALKSMEKYIFLVLKISRKSSNTKSSDFYRLAKHVHKEIKNVKDVSRIVSEYISGNNLEIGYYQIKKFEEHIEEKFSRNKKDGFYGWDELKYFLYEYDVYLMKTSKSEQEKINWNDYDKREKVDSVEHVLPKGYVSVPYWKQNFFTFKEKEMIKLCNTLGNLVPLSQKKNSTLQNASFPDKKRKGDIGYFNGSYSEIEIAQKEKWTSEEILERGLKLLDFLERRWEIKIGSEEDKLRLLGIEFLKNSVKDDK